MFRLGSVDAVSRSLGPGGAAGGGGTRSRRAGVAAQCAEARPGAVAAAVHRKATIPSTRSTAHGSARMGEPTVDWASLMARRISKSNRKSASTGARAAGATTTGRRRRRDARHDDAARTSTSRTPRPHTPQPEAFGGLPAEASAYDSAAIVVLPVPYDGTSTWKKGADRGPEAILAASANMELYDIPTRSEVWRRGIHTLPAIRHRGGPDELADKVQTSMAKAFADGKFPVLLGGEHSVSIGAFRAAAGAFPSLSILQIDAHGDTRESYHGSPCNHACVMARARELCSITQVGIRAIDVEEVAAMKPKRVFFAHDIVGVRDDDKWIDQVVKQQSENVYVTIDLDAFDPSIVPATGTPEPGGLQWHQVERLLHKLCKRRNVVGLDVVELLPTPGQWASEFVAAKLVYRALSEIFANRGE